MITIVTFIESRGKRMVSLLVGTTRCSLDNVTLYFLQCQLPSLPESVNTFTSKRTVPILYQFIILFFFFNSLFQWKIISIDTASGQWTLPMSSFYIRGKLKRLMVNIFLLGVSEDGHLFSLIWSSIFFSIIIWGKYHN